MERLSLILWRERDLLETLLFKLEEEQLLLANGRTRWLMRAHRYQLEPDHDNWSIWMLLAGRGAGKTRTAAEAVPRARLVARGLSD